jgi:hypothetical protein
MVVILERVPSDPSLLLSSGVGDNGRALAGVAVPLCKGMAWVECRAEMLTGRWTLLGGGAITSELRGLDLLI